MPSAALPLLDAAQARAGDEAAVAAGESWPGLMHRAAGHLARGVVAAAGGRATGRRVVLLVGKGNNGGDGWAAARRLRDEHGAHCTVVAVDGIDVSGSEEALTNRTSWLDSGGRTVAGTDHLDAILGDAEVVVDCLLGTGARGAPRGPAGEAVTALARLRRGVPPRTHAPAAPVPSTRAAADPSDLRPVVVACDIPSGVDADDGTVAELAVHADVTVTFGALKRGLLLHPGAARAGRILVGSLGIAYDRFAADTATWWALTPDGAAPEPLPPAADKRARGVLLAVAGAVGTAGAAALTGAGALRTGAGLVTVATPDAVRTEVAACVDAGVMVRGLPADEQGGVHPDAVHALPPLPAEPAGAVVAGPGLGVGRGAGELVSWLRARAGRLVLDADALNVHREEPATLADHIGALVLTPHERELARIGGGSDGPDAWRHRAVRVPDLAARYDATIVAKGPGTLVAAPDGRVWVCPLGGPALGSGGTGDVLAGIIGAAVAAAVGPEAVPLAVARAVWWHAAAGQLAGRDRADRATASDLLAVLPEVFGVLAAGAAQRTGARDRHRPAGAAGHAAAWGALPWEGWSSASSPAAPPPGPLAGPPTVPPPGAYGGRGQ